MSKNTNTKAAKSTKAKAKKPVVVEPKIETVKGTWQDDLVRSTDLLVKSDKDRSRASALLWDGAKAGIESWDREADPSAENFGREVTDLLGKKRKGDASKIKTVALAVANAGLDLNQFANLSKAYAEATRLTKTVKVEKDEDDAAEEAISSLDVPKTASSGEAAAKIVLAKGVDEAARLLLDALGDANFDAHRSLLRAVSQEINGRSRAAKEAERKAKVVDAPKAKAKQASKAKAEVQPAASKAKPVAKGKVAKAEVTDEQGTLDITEAAEVTSIEGEKAKPQVKAKAKPVVKPRPKVAVKK